MPTWTAGNVITVSFLNAIKDNFNETAPAKATGTLTAGHFVPNGVNVIAQREIKEQEIATRETTTSNTYVNLTTVGPAVTVTTGTSAVVSVTCQIDLGTAGAYGCASVAWAAVAADDSFAYVSTSAAAAAPFQGTSTNLIAGLTSGSNTFTEKYRVATGSPVGGFQRRRLLVQAL